MRALVLGLMILATMSAQADSIKLCQNAYENHFERLELIRELARSEELSSEKVDSRVKDSEDILEISKSIMCKGISKKNLATIKEEARYNASNR